MNVRRPLFSVCVLGGAALPMLLAAPLPVARGENWPGWRGPHRTGLTEDVGPPENWSSTEGVLWKADLPGEGISNPIVWEDRVIVTSSDGPRQEELHVVCLSRDGGRELWHRRLWGTAPTLYHAQKSSMASPSPVTDGQRVFAFFGTGDVFCFDMQGQLQWQRSLADEYGAFENRFAASSSPLLFGDLLILQCDHYGASYLLAIDVATGVNRWRREREDVWLSWSSPQLVPADDGRHELVLCGSERVDGFDPADGAPLWTVHGMARECVPTPVLGHGLVYAVSGPGGATCAIRPGGRGDVTRTHVEWRSELGAPFVPSAILVGDYYYLVHDKGVLTCLEARTGKQAWRKRLEGSYTASPVCAAGKIYFVNEEGSTIVIEADSRKYREVAHNEIDEPVYASPAIADGKLYLRAAKRLYCIGER